MPPTVRDGLRQARLADAAGADDADDAMLVDQGADCGDVLAPAEQGRQHLRQVAEAQATARGGIDRSHLGGGCRLARTLGRRADEPIATA